MLVACASWIAGCGAEDQVEPTPVQGPSLSVGDDGKAISVAPSELLTISLPAQKSTGFGWEVDALDASVLRLAGREHVSAPNLGGQDTQILRFASVSRGHTQLTLAYRRAWEATATKGLASASDTPTFTVSVESTGPFTGKYVDPSTIPAISEPYGQGSSALSVPSSFTYCDASSCTPIKDQGQCGGCWAFASTGVMEQAVKKASGTTLNLSEQHLISCNTYGYTCAQGGDQGFPWYLSTADKSGQVGTVYGADYPFTAKDASCVSKTHHEKIASWTQMTSGTATTDQLKQAIYDHGALWVAVCADSTWDSYRGGVYQGSSTCTKVNHAIILTGWDDSTGTFLLRNSWGKSWGESGYMRIKYGVNGLGRMASYLAYSSGTCTPACSGKVCGSDGCGGSCGSCSSSQTCDSSGQCSSSTFSLGVATTGSGTVTSSPSGISCGSTCSASYASGTAVTLTATAASGSTFTGWGGACSGTASCTLTMSAAQSVTATFQTSLPSPSAPVSINAGGSAASDWLADAYFSGGTTYSNTNTIDTSLLTGTAPPQGVFQTERYGQFTYTIPGRTAGGAYTVTLYFEESHLTASGQRLFDVSINGAQVLSAFDIYAATGGQNKAIAKSFDTTADASGQVAIQFTTGAIENPKVCGITVAPRVATCSASPSAPSGLTATTTATGMIQLAWQAVTGPANCAVTYSVFRGSSQVATGLTGLSFADTGLATGTTYTYTVRAVDTVGSSAASSAASATTLVPPDTQPPSAPSSLTAMSIGSTTVTLSWGASSDDVGVTGYDVFWGTTSLGSSTTTSATLSNLTPGTTYTFTVKARDAAKNVSAASTGVTVTTQLARDLTPPSAPANLAWSNSGMTVTMSCQSSTDDVGVVAYDLYLGSSYLGSFDGTTVTLIGFKTGTPYTFSLKARDAAGNVSEASNPITVLISMGQDTSPPSTPTGLSAISMTASAVTIGWSASTDDVGVVVYQVLMDGNVVATVASVRATVAVSVSGVAHVFTVIALDAAGNASAPSQPLTVTLP
jgi:C1A family cysteine protease/chitodextrinase